MSSRLARWTACVLSLEASSALAQDGVDLPVPTAPTPAAPTPSPAAEAPPSSALGGIEKLFAIVRAEPSVRAVQRAALRYYELEPERVNRTVVAARLKGLIPEIEGSFDRTIGDSFSNTRDGLYPILPDLPENPNPNNFRERQTTGQTQDTFRVRVTFNLDRVIFNAEELDARSLNSMGENLMREVTSIYFARRRLLAGIILSPPGSDLELYYELMRLDELTATLDALTGRRFASRAWDWSRELSVAPPTSGAAPRR